MMEYLCHLDIHSLTMYNNYIQLHIMNHPFLHPRYIWYMIDFRLQISFCNLHASNMHLHMLARNFLQLGRLDRQAHRSYHWSWLLRVRHNTIRFSFHQTLKMIGYHLRFCKQMDPNIHAHLQIIYYIPNCSLYIPIFLDNLPMQCMFFQLKIDSTRHQAPKRISSSPSHLQQCFR